MKFYPPGTRIAGRYEVASRPLTGGMGIVYLCNDLEEDRPVALKTFKPEYLPDRAARDRFLREGTTWVDLGRHPHIVRAYGVERIGDGREVYLVLELVAKEEGRADASLRSWLVPGGPLPVEQALLFALQIARGMAHATATIPGLVHRDLKPENVLVGADRLSNAEVNRLRVTDFGLAAVLREVSGKLQPKEQYGNAAEGRTLLTRGIVGTPEYMAPEQWEERDIDARADIYALGCILVEMLTGQTPVKAKPRIACRQLHQGGQALKAVRGLPKATVSALGDCLAVNPADRCVDWGVVEEALEAAYAEVTGQVAPEPEPMQALSRAERVAMGWSYSEMGLSYVDIGKADVALGYFERARDVGQAEGERRLEAAGQDHLGLAYTDLGDTRRAIGCHKQALAIWREIGDRRGEGNALGNLGNTCDALGDTRQAIGHHKQALAIARDIGDRQNEGKWLGNLGSICLNLGNTRQAIEYYEQALAIARDIGDRQNEGSLLANLGEAYRRLGNARQAIGFFEQALAIARGIGNWRSEGRTLGNLGITYFQLGDVRRAIECYEQQLVITREIGDRVGEGAALGNLGTAYSRLGNARQAIGFFEKCLTVHREISDRRGEGADLGNLGLAYAALGDAQRAIGLYEQALKILCEIGDRRGEGNILGNLGEAYRLLGDVERAIEFNQQALKINREIGDVLTAAMISANLAMSMAQAGRVSEALPLAEQAVRDFHQAGYPQLAQPAEQILAQIRAALR